MDAEELKVGDHVTLLRGRMMNYPPGTIHEDRSFKGSLLRVECLDLPFVVIRELVSEYGRKPYSDSVKAIDSREVEFKRPSEAFVSTMLSGLPLVLEEPRTPAAHGNKQEAS